MDIDESSRAYQDASFQYQIPKEIQPSTHGFYNKSINPINQSQKISP